MISVGWIISVSLFLLSFFGIVTTSLIFAKPVDEYKFSFLRMFPFEVPRTAEENGRYYSFSTYLFSGLCFTPLVSIVQNSTSLKNLNPISIIIVCLFGLASLCFVFLNIFDVTHVKAHISLFTVFAFLTLLGTALVGVRGFTAYDLLLSHGKKELLFLITAALAELVAVFIVVIIVNPKLKSWARLDKTETGYARPKRFPLAYSEWGLLLSLFLGELIYFIQLLAK